MSEIKVDKISGKTSANAVTVTGENGSTQTSLQQGLAKAWANYNGTGTVAIRDNLNVGSITDNGTGNYTINFTSNMANANFSVGGMTGGNTSDPNTTSGAILCPQQTASTFIIRTGSATSDSDLDREFTFCNVHGDLA